GGRDRRQARRGEAVGGGRRPLADGDGDGPGEVGQGRRHCAGDGRRRHVRRVPHPLIRMAQAGRRVEGGAGGEAHVPEAAAGTTAGGGAGQGGRRRLEDAGGRHGGFAAVGRGDESAGEVRDRPAGADGADRRQGKDRVDRLPPGGVVPVHGVTAA